MREILFKAKRISDGKWIEGSLIVYSDQTTGIVYDIGDIEGMRKEVVRPETVCQYTGLTDRNGKKIFEGDIIHWTNWNGEQKEASVCYDQEWNRFCVWLNGAESMGVNIHLSTSGIVVIGSIHDGEGDYVQRG